MSDLTREEQALTRAADLVQGARADLNKTVGEMPSRLATKGTWEGGGATGFTNLITVWNNETSRIVKALDDFERNLTSADKGYTNVDDAQQDKYNQFANRLQGA